VYTLLAKLVIGFKTNLTKKILVLIADEIDSGQTSCTSKIMGILFLLEYLPEKKAALIVGYET
jgi:hypothetical protein